MKARPEARFITLCVREPDASRPRALRHAATLVRDWDAVVRLAAEHRVAAFVRSASSAEDIRLPTRTEGALRQIAMAAVARAMLLEEQLRRIAAVFETEGLPLIVLKGPGLARTLYPRPELRPYGDLDLTVRGADEAAAIAALEACGLREIDYAAEAARRARASHLHGGAAFHRIFVGWRDEVRVELHLDPLQLGLAPVCEAERWLRARPIPDLTGALMLAPADQVVQLSLHALKHGFERLIWLKDLDLQLRHEQEMNWRQVQSVSEREGIAAAVWYALCLSRILLRTPVPAAVEQRLAPSIPLQALYRAIWRPSRVAALDGSMRRRAVQFHAAESYRGMIPSLILMGRRSSRLSAILQHLQQRRDHQE